MNDDPTRNNVGYFKWLVRKVIYSGTILERIRVSY